MTDSNKDFPEIKLGEQQQAAKMSLETPGTIVSKTNLPISDQPWEEWVKPVFDFLGKLPDDIGFFFSDYKKPLITLFLLISGAVTVYVTLAVLDALNDIPLLSPLLELVGLSYSAWFVYRYLLRESNRSELFAEFKALKAQVMGKNDN
jgi:CAAD domains of cyanobacterial aminoacyl-tRNA synthetase